MLARLPSVSVPSNADSKPVSVTQAVKSFSSSVPGELSVLIPLIFTHVEF